MSDLSENLVEFYERLSSWEQNVIKDSGYTLQQIHTVQVIGNSGPTRMKDLALKLGVVMGTLTVMINRLTKMGLVLRKSNMDDGRSYSICLTAKGKKLYQEHCEHHNFLAAEISEGLSKKEEEQFNLIVKKILERI